MGGWGVVGSAKRGLPVADNVTGCHAVGFCQCFQLIPLSPTVCYNVLTGAIMLRCELLGAF
jgi:hypothetical protein